MTCVDDLQDRLLRRGHAEHDAPSLDELSDQKAALHKHRLRHQVGPNSQI
jgi:hypothetical protein